MRWCLWLHKVRGPEGERVGRVVGWFVWGYVDGREGAWIERFRGVWRC